MKNQWKTIREEFPVTKNRVFFDNAKVAPIPKRTQEIVTTFVEDASNFGTANYPQWMEKVQKVRESFAHLIGARQEEVAFVKNTSEGLSIVANGIDWKSGENVVIPDIEFPANVYPWQNLKRHGVETRMVSCQNGRVDFEKVTEAVDEKTRILSISSVECNSGFRNDLARLGEFCKKREIYFCVDAIQSLGAIQINVKDYHIDFLMADGHKWLLSVEGLGGFYISSKVLEKIYPVVVGWNSMVDAYNFMDYHFAFRPDARRFEEGTFNTMSIQALGASLSLFHEIGMATVEARIFELGDYLIEGIKKRNLPLFNSENPNERSGIVAFTYQDNDILEFMNQREVSLTVRDGLVRLSPHIYNNEEDVDKFFEILDDYLSK